MFGSFLTARQQPQALILLVCETSLCAASGSLRGMDELNLGRLSETTGAPERVGCALVELQQWESSGRPSLGEEMSIERMLYSISFLGCENKFDSGNAVPHSQPEASLAEDGGNKP